MNYESGSSVTSEDVRTEVPAGDAPVGHVLNSRPILSSEERLIAQPLRDGLLFERGPIHERRHACRQGGLTVGDLDSATKSGNVRFIHEHPGYTTRVVHVNDLGCVQGGTGLATVLPMPPPRSSVQKAPSPRSAPAKRVRQAQLGSDGRTLGDRLKMAMTQYARQHGRTDWESYTQAEWIDLASRAVGRNPEEEPVMTQQNLSLILGNKSSTSDGIVAFGVLLGAEPAWLLYAYGPPTLMGRLAATKP